MIQESYLYVLLVRWTWVVKCPLTNGREETYNHMKLKSVSALGGSFGNFSYKLELKPPKLDQEYCE